MKTIGNKGEDLAADYLKRKGYRIVSRNFKTLFGEIDIIAEDRNTLVFVEVKTRTDDSFGHPFEAVHRRKQEKMKRVALSYLKKNKRECPARFDVLSIEISDGRGQIEHIVDAFE